MSEYKDLKKELLEDKTIKKAYKDLWTEFAVIEIIIESASSEA